MVSNKRILITGVTGFLGTGLKNAFTSIGYEVWGISRKNHEARRIIQGDLISEESASHALSQVPDYSVVIHAAALAHSKDKTPGQSYSDINLAITRNLINIIQEKNIKLIFLSSVAVYGMDGRDYSVSVDDTVKPATEYGWSKLKCEEIIKTSNINNYYILRLGPVFDEHYLDDLKKRVFFPGQNIFKYRITPNPSYSLCQLNTAISKILELVESAVSKKQVMNIADPSPYTQRQLAQQFDGIEIPFPAFLLTPIFSILSLIPSKKCYAMQCLLGKLFKNNIYV